MSNDLFGQGGPYDIRRTGPDQFSLKVDLPKDEMGMTARECPSGSCSPGAFKIKFGTGVDEEQENAFCPYCRRAEDPDEFLTEQQMQYCEDIVAGEAIDGINRMMKNALGLGSTGRKRIGGGMLSVEMRLEPSHRPPVRRPREELLRRDITCPHCTLEHAVYGLAVWCPDCGADIFLTHVETESSVIRSMLNDVDRRNSTLGPRVAARDIENSLEDVVSLLEASMKAMVRRRLLTDGKSEEDIDRVM